MENLLKQDYEDILNLNHVALECTSVNEMRKKVLRLLQNFFRCKKVSFFLTCESGKKFDFNRTLQLGFNEELYKKYKEYYNNLDPFKKYFFSSKDLIFTSDEIIPLRYLTLSKFYHEFYKPMGIYYSMGICLRSKKWPLGVVGIYRSKGDINFSHRERAIGEILSPLLTAALEKALFKEKIQKNQWVIDAITADLPYIGILVLDDNLQPIYINKNAMNILSPQNGSINNKDEDFLSIPQEIYLRCQDLKKSISTKNNFNTSQQKFHLSIFSFQGQIDIDLHMIYSENETPIFLVYLKPSDHILSLHPSLKNLGVTNRELEIINCLSQGLKNAEISEKLFISEHTVKNHLYNIFEKLSVTNRTMLIQRAIQLQLIRLPN